MILQILEIIQTRYKSVNQKKELSMSASVAEKILSVTANLKNNRKALEIKLKISWIINIMAA